MCLFLCVCACVCTTVCLSQVAVRESAVGRGGREAEGTDGGWPNGEELAHTHTLAYSLCGHKGGWNMC